MEITGEELKNKIKNNESIIVDFWAPWCGPCKVMKPKFENVAQSTRAKMFTLNVADHQDIALELGIRAIPTIKTFKNGSNIETHVGVLTEATLTELAKKYEDE
jgi:thioredoxin